MNCVAPKQPFGKRAFDVVIASTALTVCAPALILVAFLVRRESRGGAFYRAPRVGRGGETFIMYKFRTMTVGTLGTGSPTTGLNDPRVTPLGRALRRYKIDELPQLLNVVRGDMSLVGPRPEVEECVALYTDEQRRILSVRPGLTDLASIEFVDLASAVGESQDPHQVYLETVFDKKNALRLKYVQEVSWRTDLSILMRTLRSVVGQK